MGTNNEGFDDDYLNDVAGLGDGQGNDNTVSEGDGGNEQQSQQLTQPVNEPTDRGSQQNEAEQQQTATVPPTQPRPNENSQQPTQAQQGTVPAGLQRHVSGNFVNERGDIVRADGTVIAPRGSSRRLFELNGRLQTQNNELTARYQQLERQAQETRLLNDIPRQFGLTNDEVAAALDLQARLKRGDVLSVAKDVVAMLAAKGHNITDLFGGEVGDSVEMRALQRMLDERFAPIQQQNQQRQREEQINAQARREYERFVSDNQYADIHGDIIVQFMNQNRTSMQQAYNAVRDFAARNGFDFSQPLGPQIEAMVARQRQQSQQQQSPSAPQNGRPMPNGAAFTRPNGVQPITPAFADPDDDWGTIIRRAMADEGAVN